MTNLEKIQTKDALEGALNKSIEEIVQEIKLKVDNEDNDPLMIALFGQPGAGKSSIINSLVGKEIAEVDVRTDTTVEAAIYDSEKI